MTTLNKTIVGIKSDSDNLNQIKRIITYLNRKTGRTGRSKFRYTSPRSQKLLIDRFRDGYNLEDFKRVIDIKFHEWFYDEKMKKYLRPTTLFGNKFKLYAMQIPPERILL